MASRKQRLQRKDYQGIYSLHKYTAEQIEFLKTFCGKNQTVQTIRDAFNQRFATSLSTVKIRQKLKSCQIDFKMHSNSSTQGFMKKHYKKEGKPHPREKPLGTIRNGRDGKEIKVANIKGAGRKNWISLSKHIYQQANNVVLGKNEMILHIDGDVENSQLENLIVIHRRDIGAINNQLSQIPPEQIDIRRAKILMVRIEQLRKAKTGEETASMRYNRKQKEREQKE